MTEDELEIPTAARIAARLRVLAREELKDAIRNEVADAPPTLIVELVGRALGEIIGEDVQKNHDIILHLCQHRLSKAFNDGLRNARGL